MITLFASDEGPNLTNASFLGNELCKNKAK